ncbi:MAG: hypothetical protein U0T84_11605 [Chitinophagales bacterium]
MKKWFAIFLFSCSFAIVSAGGDEFSKRDNWINLIAASGMAPAKFRLLCPNFPKYENGFSSEQDYKNFVKARYEWFKSSPSELTNFMHSPEIAAINPAPGDLGLDEKLYREELLPDPLWQRLKYAYISEKELHSFAPHFPKWWNTGDTTRDLRNFQRAAADWKILYAQEWANFNNHPKLHPSSGLKPDQKYTTVLVPAADLFRQLPKQTGAIPQEIDFRSGNAELDRLRYETYLKKWYFDNQPQSYYRLYEPNRLIEYQKQHAFPGPGNP